MDDQRDPMSVLEWCIYDFLMGRNMNHLAEQFAIEANVNINGMDSEGYLTDWWLLCWEMYHSRTHPRALGEQHILGTQINTNQFPTTNSMQIPPMNQQRRVFVPSDMHSSSLGSNMNSSHGQQFTDESIQQLFVNGSNQQQDEHASDMGRTVAVISPLVPVPNAIGSEVRTNSEPVEAPPLVPQSQKDSELKNLADGVDIGSFLCNDEEENHDAANNITERNGFTFQEAGRLGSFPGKLVCCDFSPNGKLLASGGHDKKVTIWNMESSNHISTAEEHNHLITDVRFGANSTVFGTSSFDCTVRIWDLNNVTKSIVKLDGHGEQVTSLDFHSQKNILCSCDMGGCIRLWDVEKGLCSNVLQGASKKIRFMPGSVDLLAAVHGNMIGMLDTNTGTCWRSTLIMLGFHWFISRVCQ